MLCVTGKIKPWLADSHSTRPVLQDAFPCHGVIMLCHHIDGLLQDCSNSSALAMELLQSCTKPSILWFIVCDLTVAQNKENVSTWDPLVKAPSQWETTQHCNVASHWLCAFIKWSLYTGVFYTAQGQIVRHKYDSRLVPLLSCWLPVAMTQAMSLCPGANHYCDVIMGMMASQITLRLFTQPFIQT